MPRRAKRTKATKEQLTLTIGTATVFLWRSYASSRCDTYIQIEGQAVGHLSKLVRDASLSVSSDSPTPEVVGYALGGKTPWRVSCCLPRAQFTDLLAIVLADKLHGVTMVFDELRWHKGTLLSVHFATSKGD